MEEKKEHEESKKISLLELLIEALKEKEEAKKPKLVEAVSSS
jgi:hypothetical protein